MGPAESNTSVADGEKPSLQLKVFTSPTRPIRGDGNRTFSPTTSTLIFGARDAVLVDSQMIAEDVDALGDMIASTGKRLTTIYITHGHGDHFFGSDRLIARFPSARVVTTPSIVAYIAAHLDADLKWFGALFGDAVVSPISRPSALSSNAIDLEGNKLRVIEVGQGDIAPSAVLHIPSIDAVIAGDVAYNQIHQMLGFGGPAEWEKWIASVETIERLQPRIVVAGHKKPEAPDDQAQAILGGTRAYIQDFAEGARTSRTAEELIEQMRSRYPNHGNLTTLYFSAGAAMKAKASSQALS